LDRRSIASQTAAHDWESWQSHGEPIAIEPQVFDFIRNRDRVVTKDDLLGSV